MRITLEREVRLVTAMSIQVPNQKGEGGQVALHHPLDHLQHNLKLFHRLAWIKVYCNYFDCAMYAMSKKMLYTSRDNLTNNVGGESLRKLFRDAQSKSTSSTTKNN